MDFDRRRLLKQGGFLGALLALGAFEKILQAAESSRGNPSLNSYDIAINFVDQKADNRNFAKIYANPLWKADFFPFLVNVFHLYPEIEFHQLIAAAVENKNADDESAYREIQKRLPEIKSWLSNVNYALPALIKQKNLMTQQTLQLLGAKLRFDGYLEIGSTGRYISSLKDHLQLTGEIFLASDEAPSYSIVDILERGQLSKMGVYIPMNNYKPDFAKVIAATSLDLVTVYIGFHHCPLLLRDEFLGSIRQTLKPGGRMVVRDHDVTDEKMSRLVGLAHDVFNLGTERPWSYNAAELRNFYSLDTLDQLTKRHGFERMGPRLFQDGDPTHNALTVFRKV